MKLSEVIKAVEDGSKSSFRCGDIVIKSMYNAIEVLTGKWKVDSDFNNDNWEEVKPPRQWSEKELMLFKLLPDWAKWIAIDKDYSIWVYANKPENNDIILEETLINMLKCANSEFDTEKVVFEMKEEVFFTRGITVTASIEIK